MIPKYFDLINSFLYIDILLEPHRTRLLIRINHGYDHNEIIYIRKYWLKQY